jgi:hypothetical protein
MKGKLKARDPGMPQAWGGLKKVLNEPLPNKLKLG